MKNLIDSWAISREALVQWMGQDRQPVTIDGDKTQLILTNHFQSDSVHVQIIDLFPLKPNVQRVITQRTYERLRKVVCPGMVSYVEIDVCSDCGSVVADKHKHDHWHLLNDKH